MIKTQTRDHRSRILKKKYFLNRNGFRFLTLIRESWKKIQNSGPSPSVFCGKNPERSVASLLTLTQYEGKLFPGKNLASFIEKSKAQKHIQTCTNDATLRSGFFQQNTLGDSPTFWIFPGFADKG